ncbi:DUF1489 domain-containing protein [Altererythrobacter sp. CC-YST694]|uniref:DUF1489 family protein n=1 Tax=Altererythrobacter sp. CC-YST694 TaxID=2755038 RepID=UPI001D01B9F4|nr:DUF1489 domain-containing protein [Altererythrobacter sp. CC-YST694]MCB5424052.1 DUF1489 domain-containing protein [Altererythrobacter sp. CC-YST694]
MPLHLTKIAYGAQSMEDLRSWFEEGGPEMRLTTRYVPKRLAELEDGSLYWIYDHALVGRSPILRFEQREDNGRWWIVLERKLIPVEPRAKRAHQGWRYLDEENAPPDLDEGSREGDVLPGHLVKDLAKLGLV